MKRYGNLFDRIRSFENLIFAANSAKRGKKYRPDVAKFHFDLENQLFELRNDLTSRNYQPGEYMTFHIQDPKPRLISAAPYRDRVVHHALCRVIEPIFEKTFVFDNYANRIGKGSHLALDRCTFFSRRFKYVLKCDIVKYFPSIDHDILYRIIGRKIKCRETLWLIRKIIDNSNPQEEVITYFPGDDLFTPIMRRHGIPIGNLTSQYFANIYLNQFDHFVKEVLSSKAYIRFCDDFLLFSNDKAQLRDFLCEISSYLERFRLKVHPRKSQIVPTRCGVDFLGWRVYPDHRRLRRSTGIRIQKNLKALVLNYSTGTIPLDRVRASVMSYIGHLSHGDTWGLRKKLLTSSSFVKPRIMKNP